MKVVYSPEALNDLTELKTYISKVLKNKTAANRIVNMLFQSCRLLKEYPALGVSLEGYIGKSTDLRYIGRENWLIFYRVQSDSIQIIRILDGRTDYLKLLFSNQPAEDLPQKE